MKLSRSHRAVLAVIFIGGLTLASCQGSDAPEARGHLASGRSGPSPDCPRHEALLPGGDARQAAIEAARRAIPRFYTHLDTRRYTVERSYPADAQRAGFAAIPSGMCGEQVGGRTWVVELHFPEMEPSASLSNGQLFVSRFRDGWWAWFAYH